MNISKKVKLFNKTTAGFTLIELIIAVAIIGIIVAFALPAYNEYVKKTQRLDAMNSLMDLQLEQEKWRGNDTDYATLGELGVGNTSNEGLYTIAVVSNAATSFTATATPVVGSRQENDVCGTFAINQDGPLHTGVYSDADCWRK